MRDSFVKSISNFEVLDLLGESFCEVVVNALLDVDPIGAHASLSTATELACNSAINSSLEICIVKYNEAGRLINVGIKAVGQKTHGALPPNSKESFFNVSADCFMSSFPTPVDPVKL